MIRKYGTINEEVNRIKSLFGESRLYGNLVEQDEQSDDVCEWFKPNQVEALDILKEVLSLAKIKKISLIFEPEEQKKIGVLIKMLEDNIKTIEDINCEEDIVIVCSTENTTKIDGGIELLNSKLEDWSDGENEDVKTKLERLVVILNEIKGKCADAVGDHNDETPTKEQIVTKRNNDYSEKIEQLKNTTDKIERAESENEIYKLWLADLKSDVEDIKGRMEVEEDPSKELELLMEMNLIYKDISRVEKSIGVNDEIIKDKEGGNPKNSDELIKIIMDPDSSDDDKKGAIDTLKSTFDIDLSDGKPLTMDSDTGVEFHEFNLEKPKEGPFGTYLSSDGVLIYKKEELFSDLNITTTDPNAAEKLAASEKLAAEKLAAEDDKPKMKEGYNTEEDIIYISEKEGNREFKLGKMEYDKDKEVFKIISKYPFYSKKTDYLVKRTEESFWNTLSKWYTKELNSDNTTLDIKNGKKFKVIIK